MTSENFSCRAEDAKAMAEASWKENSCEKCEDLEETLKDWKIYPRNVTKEHINELHAKIAKRDVMIEKIKKFLETCHCNDVNDIKKILQDNIEVV
jgi:hypothetical protein